MKNVCFIIAQVLGILTFVLNTIGHTKLTTKKVYAYNAICNGIGVLEYLLLGAFSGALCCFIACARNFVFSRYKEKVPLYVLLIYIVLVIVLNYKLVNNVFDIIPIINIILYAVALWTKDIMKIKKTGLFTFITGVIYDFNKRAYATVLTEIIDGIIAVRCIIILNKKKKLS